MRNFQHDLEEFLRTTEWGVNWIEGYHQMLSKDTLREFRDYLKQADDYTMKDIYHIHGEKFAIEIFGKERVRKYMNSVEFRNDITHNG